MLSREIERFVGRYTAYTEEKREPAEDGAEKIHVDEIASKVAAFYEKIRNAIEYHDAHLLRKTAIERILRRRVFLQDFDAEFAEPLIKELIRSGHLPNDSVPETKIGDVQKIIDNLLALLKHEADVPGARTAAPETWLIRMFALRIEEELFPYPEGALLAETMYSAMKEKLVLKNIPLSENDADLQLFVAVQKALFRADRDQLEYALLKVMYPAWGNLGEQELAKASLDLGNLHRTIQSILENPFAPSFARLANHEKIVFQLLGDLVFDQVPLEEDFESHLKFLYAKRYQKAQKQLRRLAFLSVISFLVSKLVIALAIEIPLDQYFYHTISITSMAINILFPPILMLIIVLATRLPSKKNFALVEGELQKVIRGDEKQYIANVPQKKGWVASGFVYLAYTAALLAVLYYITKILLWLHFSPASIVIFLLFTSMVTATGVKVKNRAREMSLEKEKASIGSFLFDLITVPFMAIGQWTISGLSNFNVLVIAFDFLIELPVQFFVEFVENFRSFIRAKKDEVN